MYFVFLIWFLTRCNILNMCLQCLNVFLCEVRSIWLTPIGGPMVWARKWMADRGKLKQHAGPKHPDWFRTSRTGWWSSSDAHVAQSRFLCPHQKKSVFRTVLPDWLVANSRLETKFPDYWGCFRTARIGCWMGTPFIHIYLLNKTCVVGNRV